MTAQGEISPAESRKAIGDGRSEVPGAPTAARSVDRQAELKLPRFTAPLHPLINLVARTKAGVHLKLLCGFLVLAALLLGMGVLSQVVITRMNDRVSHLRTQQDKIDMARQMEYQITAQSHFRAMALLTQDSSNNDKIAAAKKLFAQLLDTTVRLSPNQAGDLFTRVRDANTRFTASSDRVLALYLAGNNDEAMRLHLSEEHPVSHELEAAMRELQRDAIREIQTAIEAYESDRTLLTTLVAGFCAVSLALALLLGFVLSWAFIQPMRKINRMLADLAGGDFAQRVDVPNRDEFGQLGQNLNRTSMRLEGLYNELRGLNTNLEQKVQDQLSEIERASTLRRYLSPQVAESILGGGADVMSSRRKNLTIFFSDIRGFTAISERTEPEEFVDMLNEYLTAMTDIVFKYGGTLDKYIGDAIMVFFGDPVPYADHAERAVRMAFEMQAKVAELQRGWMLNEEDAIGVGMGICTGYVTVGSIGSPSRLEYTVIGNQVNLASRLADKATGGQILATDRTVMAVRDLVEATEVAHEELQGVSRPIKIYDVRPKDGAAALTPADEERFRRVVQAGDPASTAS